VPSVFWRSTAAALRPYRWRSRPPRNRGGGGGPRALRRRAAPGWGRAGADREGGGPLGGRGAAWDAAEGAAFAAGALAVGVAAAVAGWRLLALVLGAG